MRLMYEIYRHKPEDELPIIIIIVYVQHEDSHFISRLPLTKYYASRLRNKNNTVGTV